MQCWHFPNLGENLVPEVPHRFRWTENCWQDSCPLVPARWRLLRRDQDQEAPTQRRTSWGARELCLSLASPSCRLPCFPLSCIALLSIAGGGAARAQRWFQSPFKATPAHGRVLLLIIRILNQVISLFCIILHKMLLTQTIISTF